MTRSCSRIALIERPINEPIEKHRCRAGKYHTNNHQEQNSPRGPAVCCHNQRAKRKRQRKDRVRKTNQPQKSRYRSAKSDSVGSRSFQFGILFVSIRVHSWLTVWTLEQTAQPFTGRGQDWQPVREKHSLGFIGQKFS